MTIAAITEGLAFIFRAVKAAVRRRDAVDVPVGEKLLKDTEASVAEVDKLAAGTVK
jgi:hypothetical protein